MSYQLQLRNIFLVVFAQYSPVNQSNKSLKAIHFNTFKLYLYALKGRRRKKKNQLIEKPKQSKAIRLNTTCRIGTTTYIPLHFNYFEIQRQ